MIVVALGIVLLIAGAGAGSVFAVRAADSAGLLDIEPELGVPAFIGGIAVGMLPGLVLIALNNRSAWSVRKVVLAAIGATALGGALYAVLVGGLVWLIGLALPSVPTRILAVILSIVGLPVVGPITYQLISGRRANELPGGRPLPAAVYKIRRGGRSAAAAGAEPAGAETDDDGDGRPGRQGIGRRYRRRSASAPE